MNNWIDQHPYLFYSVIMYAILSTNTMLSDCFGSRKNRSDKKEKTEAEEE